MLQIKDHIASLQGVDQTTLQCKPLLISTLKGNIGSCISQGVNHHKMLCATADGMEQSRQTLCGKTGCAGFSVA